MVVASPHNLRLDRHIGVITSENSRGKLVDDKNEIVLGASCDRELASMILLSAERRGLPVVGANYGTSEGPLSEMPMDWGTLVPLWFFLKTNRLKSRIVIVTPSREIPLRQNFEFGRVVAEVSERYQRRVAFVASADQAHAHRKDGPYGFSPDAAVYDSRVKRAIEEDNLKSVLGFGKRLVEAAKPDSLWQMAMLAGILEKAPMTGRLVSYQVPSYYGMICAGYARKS